MNGEVYSVGKFAHSLRCQLFRYAREGREGRGGEGRGGEGGEGGGERERRDECCFASLVFSVAPCICKPTNRNTVFADNVNTVLLFQGAPWTPS